MYSPIDGAGIKRILLIMTNTEATRTIKTLARTTYSAEGRNCLDLPALKAVRIHAREDVTVAEAVEALGQEEAATIYYAELEQCSL